MRVSINLSPETLIVAELDQRVVSLGRTQDRRNRRRIRVSQRVRPSGSSGRVRRGHNLRWIVDDFRSVFRIDAEAGRQTGGINRRAIRGRYTGTDVERDPARRI